jgi:Tol biopolymer transport system component
VLQTLPNRRYTTADGLAADRNSDSKLVSNSFRYDIANKKHTQVTDLQDGYAHQFSVSPSGKWIVYEKCTIDEDKSEELDFKAADLWIIGLMGQTTGCW